jgi:hypothetical protein
MRVGDVTTAGKPAAVGEGRPGISFTA